MMWFAFDEQNKPIFFENHQTGEIYQNLDVISHCEENPIGDEAIINSDCSDDEDYQS